LSRAVREGDINRNKMDEGGSTVLWFCGDGAVNQRFSVVLDADR
jgi:hypothetical protein